MRKVKLIVSVVVATCLFAAPLALGQSMNPPASTKTAADQPGKGGGGTVDQQIKSLQAQLKQAFLKSDTTFLEKYLVDDYTAVYTSGKLFTKAQVIENFKSGAIKYESIDEREEKIHTYGNTAVVIWLFSARATINGKPFSGDVRGTRVWVKLHDDWKLVAFHSTQIPPGQ